MTDFVFWYKCQAPSAAAEVCFETVAPAPGLDTMCPNQPIRVVIQQGGFRISSPRQISAVFLYKLEQFERFLFTPGLSFYILHQRADIGHAGYRMLGSKGGS